MSKGKLIVCLAVFLLFAVCSGVADVQPEKILHDGSAFYQNNSSIERGIYEICASDRRCNPEEGVLAAKKMNATVIIITVIDNQVEKNRSAAYYPSKFVTLAPDVTQDYLNRTVRAAHQNGIKVIALINLPHEMWLAQNPDWIAVLSNGKRSDAYRNSYFYRIIPPSRILASPKMLADINGIIDEVAAYGVDGITLNDNFQFPSWYLPESKETLLSSYDAFTIARFQNDTGCVVVGDGPAEWASYIQSNPEIDNDWIKWRSQQVTKLLAVCRQDVAQTGKPVDFGPQLLVGNWVYHDNGLDYFEIAKAVDVLYPMFGDGEKNSDIPPIMQKCRNAVLGHRITSPH